jgi:hypothetical protein
LNLSFYDIYFFTKSFNLSFMIGSFNTCRALGVLLYTIVYGENPYTTTEQIIKGHYGAPHRLESDNEDLGELMNESKWI